MRTTLRLAAFVLVQLIVLASTVNCRVTPHGMLHEEDNSLDQLIEMVRGSTKPEEGCEQLYGFLPCSKNIWGHVFLIVVYEYLLFQGESYVAAGGVWIFKVFGATVFGACVPVIDCFPEAFILLASGWLSNKESADEYVVTAVGLMAGTSILLLTLVWGSCVIAASQHLDSPQNTFQRLLHSLKSGDGVETASWTGYTAKVMLVTAVPFIMVQFSRFFHYSLFWEQMFLGISLSVTVLILASYLIYQSTSPGLQPKMLLHLKHYRKANILKHLQKQLFHGDGAPNMELMKSITAESDTNKDNTRDLSKLKEFLVDMDNDNKMPMFNGFMKRLEKFLVHMKFPMRTSHSFKEVIQLVMVGGSDLIAADGNPDILSITRLFNEIDQDDDGTISYSELKDFVIKNGADIRHEDTDRIASKMMKELDITGDQVIQEHEFVKGFSKWLKTTKSTNQNSDQVPDEESASDYNKERQQRDQLVEDKFTDNSAWAYTKSFILLLTGIVMLGLLAEPLIHSVQSLSKSANVSSFFIAFIVVPLATNARIAIAAIKGVRTKDPTVKSLTFSELYATVVMNNLLGLMVLLSLAFARGLSWNFCTEVLIVLVVCIVIGSIASFYKTLPVWTSIVAILLYPVSLVLVFFFGDFHWISGGVAE